MSGNGGKTEVSARGQLHFDGLSDCSAPGGSKGALVLDPVDVVVYNENLPNMNKILQAYGNTWYVSTTSRVYVAEGWVPSDFLDPYDEETPLPPPVASATYETIGDLRPVRTRR